MNDQKDKNKEEMYKPAATRMNATAACACPLSSQTQSPLWRHCKREVDHHKFDAYHNLLGYQGDPCTQSAHNQITRYKLKNYNDLKTVQYMDHKHCKEGKSTYREKLQDNLECYGHAQVVQEIISGIYPPLSLTPLGYGQPNRIL
jgi:hypothetical protein